MSNNNSIKSKQQLNKKSYISTLIEWITEYESLVIFGGFGFAVFITIILTGIFQAGPIVRNDVLFNIVGVFVLSGVFMYIIYAFMDTTVVIYNKTIDTGMILYIVIVLFIMFIMGN